MLLLLVIVRIKGQPALIKLPRPTSSRAPDFHRVVSSYPYFLDYRRRSGAGDQGEQIEEAVTIGEKSEYGLIRVTDIIRGQFRASGLRWPLYKLISCFLRGKLEDLFVKVQDSTRFQPAKISASIICDDFELAYQP